MSVQSSNATNYARMAMGTAGRVHGRSGSGSDKQDVRDICDAILQLARAIETLAEAVK